MSIEIYFRLQAIFLNNLVYITLNIEQKVSLISFANIYQLLNYSFKPPAYTLPPVFLKPSMNRSHLFTLLANSSQPPPISSNTLHPSSRNNIQLIFHSNHTNWTSLRHIIDRAITTKTKMFTREENNSFCFVETDYTFVSTFR